jgi:hypothetical protein
LQDLATSRLHIFMRDSEVRCVPYQHCPCTAYPCTAHQRTSYSERISKHLANFRTRSPPWFSGTLERLCDTLSLGQGIVKKKFKYFFGFLFISSYSTIYSRAGSDCVGGVLNCDHLGEPKWCVQGCISSYWLQGYIEAAWRCCSP